MPDLQQLRELVAVYDCGSLSSAAEQLHLSQPALSRSMQRLEAELGLTLFERRKNRLIFRELGQRAVEGARRLLQEADAFTADLRDYAERFSIVRVGASTPAPTWRLTRILNERFSGVVVAAEQRSSEQLLAGMREGRYRLVLVNEPLEEEGFLCRKYLEERLMLELPAGHPLSGRSTLEEKDLDGLTVLTYRHLGAWLERLGRFEGLYRIEQAELDVLEDLARSSGLPVIASSLRTTPLAGFDGRVSVPILGDNALLRFYLCGHKRDRQLFELLF